MRAGMSGKSANDADVASGLRLPSAVRARSFLSLASKAFLPWALPLAGLWARASCIRTGSTPFGSPGSKSAGHFRAAGAPYPLMGLDQRGCQMTSASIAPSAFCGPDALPVRRAFNLARSGSLSEVLHRPRKR